MEPDVGSWTSGTRGVREALDRFIGLMKQDGAEFATMREFAGGRSASYP